MADSVRLWLKTINPFKTAVDTSSTIPVCLVIRSRRVTVISSDDLLGWFVSVVKMREAEEQTYFTVVVLLYGEER
uniref:Uncharacterized protein n=1 Tax=Medicago truncatula TaxID=3880 RepID=A2Q1N6_MEDTR|nr:hypothetical protein MtrDRAFT_AC148970g20v2 [Medicago truncatula]